MSKKFFIIILCFLGAGVTLQAQSLENLQNLNVENLSDAQIEQLIKRAESAGMNEQQLEAMAMERGMPAQEVSKLRQRIQEIRSGRTDLEKQSGKNILTDSRKIEGEENIGNVFDSIRKADPYYTLTPKQKKIFGYKLFHNRELDFSPSMNIPTPQNYTIGAGDQLLIDIYGASEQNYDLKVSPDGKVFIPNVGPVQVAGLTIEAATARLRSSLNNIYSGLTSNNPNTFLQIRLGDIRTIKISMVGELTKPGTYILPSFASVFNAMFAAGGPNENGSFRNIQVYRDSKLIGVVDIYDFLLNGQQSNIMLKDNDVIIVQPANTRVEITGPVRRPGLYEIKPNESLSDLIRFSGGFSEKAYKNRITLERTTEKARKVEDIGADFYNNFTPKNGDVYKVGEILDRYENRVQVSGAVYRPGEFALSEDLDMKKLIEKAGGLRGDAFTNRATLYRTKENLRQQIISVDLNSILRGLRPDIQLEREDVLHVSSIYDVNEEYYINITGEVNRTGIYPFAEGMTVEDLINQARGFKESASNSMIEIARRVKRKPDGKIADIILLDVDSDLKLSGEEEKVVLQPFDHVFVRKSPSFEKQKIVKVEGEVNYPGDFVISGTDERISDLLKRAGGPNEFAYIKGATLIRRTKNFKEKLEEEKKIENLENILAYLKQNSEIRSSEVEEKRIVRIEEKLSLLKEELGKTKGKEKDLEEISEEQQYENLLEGDINQELDQRETDLVGIELNKILENPGSSYDLILREGDVLRIPQELQTVSMRGEVLYPTTARFDTRGFKKYISRAGGFTEDSRKGKSYVIYANGEVARTKSFLGIKIYPGIEPGAEIIVPKKPEKEPLSPQAWISIGTGLATIALLMTQILGL